MKNGKNYRVGWVIPNQVGALTHYTPEVTLEEFQEISGESAQLFTDTTQDFYMIIDNRIMNMAFLPDLETIKRAAPYAHNPHLQHIIMVKPQGMAGSANDLPDYSDERVTLTYVDSLADTVALLKTQDNNLRWHEAETDFFPDAIFE